jgi:uncharacterized protein YbjT (DUF2867 family)
MRPIAALSIALTLLLSGCAPEPAAPIDQDETAKPTIALIGATARSGREIIRLALEQGYRVKGLARTPSKLGIEHDNLTLFKGDVRDQASLEAVLDGDEVVVSMVGYNTPTNPLAEVGEVDIYTVMAKNLIGAMQTRGNHRLLMASSTGVEHRVALDSDRPDPKDYSASWRWNARHLYNDMFLMEEMIAASGLDYVLLRPGFLVQEPARGDLKVDTTGTTPPARVITYADFAAFILANLTSPDYVNQAVGLYSDTAVNPAAELEKVLGKPPESMQ